MQTFILQGGAENLRWFKMTDAARAHLDYFWTCKKGVEIGDSAFIYLPAPLSRIVGRVEIVGEPFLNYPNMFQNPFMENKICARVDWRESFDETLDVLTIGNLRKVFGIDWGWVRYPRGACRIPDFILPPFLELVEKTRRLTHIARIIKD